MFRRKWNNSKQSSSQSDEEDILMDQHCSILRLGYTVQSSPKTQQPTPSPVSLTRERRVSSPESSLHHCIAQSCFKSFWRMGQLVRHINTCHGIQVSKEEVMDESKMSRLLASSTRQKEETILEDRDKVTTHLHPVLSQPQHLFQDKVILPSCKDILSSSGYLLPPLSLPVLSSPATMGMKAMDSNYSLPPFKALFAN
ncbi:hypothetical protein BD560DRAFT_401884 [Blakeslea trispora]|nr:hypothetical protein BD560DRAFT_401884 [Blakeslea trispora]